MSKKRRSKTAAFVAAMVCGSMLPGCGGSQDEEYTVIYRSQGEQSTGSEWKPIDGDKAFMANLGREAMDALGYEEIIRRAEKARWIRTKSVEERQVSRNKALVGDTATAVLVFGRVFTEYAVKAGVTSQLDSPAPGPADVLAVGILVFGLIRAGEMASQEITRAQQLQAAAATAAAAAAAAAATATPTTKPTTTTTSPPVTGNRDRWQCSASCNVQQINQKVVCPDRVTGNAGGPNEPSACVEAKRSATQSTPAGCYPRHCQCRCSRN